MSGEIIRAVTVVTCALVFYSIGVITEQRRKAVVTAVLVFLTGGVVLDVSATGLQEQRSTEWMKFESLAQALDPNDEGRTLEGYPAPARALLIAKS